MNGKKAKALRRIAQANTVGAPLGKLIGAPDGNAVHEASTTRGVYHHFKKEVVAGRMVLKKGAP